jgi:hypothetical protein
MSEGADNVRIVCQDSAWEIARGLGRRAGQRLLTSLRLPNVNTPEVRELERLAELDVEIRLLVPGIHPSTAVARCGMCWSIPDIQHEYLPSSLLPKASGGTATSSTQMRRVEPTTSARFRVHATDH